MGESLQASVKSKDGNDVCDLFVNPRVFKEGKGSTGWYGRTTGVFDGKNCTVSVMVIVQGSKPKTGKEK